MASDEPLEKYNILFHKSLSTLRQVDEELKTEDLFEIFRLGGLEPSRSQINAWTRRYDPDNRRARIMRYEEYLAFVEGVYQWVAE